MNDPFFRKWLEYFEWNAEEQCHAALLARFMAKHGLATMEEDWTDNVFRMIRKPFGYEVSLCVLITAEIIALTYYRALREATSSRLLKSICNKILDDEKAHVEYETALILHAQQDRGANVRLAWRIGQRVLFGITALVVYWEHRPVLVKGGYSLAGFLRACWADFLMCFPVASSAGAAHSRNLLGPISGKTGRG